MSVSSTSERSTSEPSTSEPSTSEPSTSESAILDAMRDVIDPELGINIVDLGLVYRVELDGGDVTVEMTMTSPACPMGAMLQEEAREAIQRQVPGLRSVTVDLVWDPPWHPGLMSDQAKRMLGWTE